MLPTMHGIRKKTRKADSADSAAQYIYIYIYRERHARTHARTRARSLLLNLFSISVNK